MTLVLSAKVPFCIESNRSTSGFQVPCYLVHIAKVYNLYVLYSVHSVQQLTIFRSPLTTNM